MIKYTIKITQVIIIIGMLGCTGSEPINHEKRNDKETCPELKLIESILIISLLNHNHSSAFQR